MKICNKCKETKIFNEFHKDQKIVDGHSNECKNCYKIYYSFYYENNKEKIKLKNRIYESNDINKNRINTRKRVLYNTDDAKKKRDNKRYLKEYGISLDEYNILIQKQNNLCAICKNSEISMDRGKIIKLTIDHCHSTGIVRGLLCKSCNLGLGKFKDDPNIILQALEYLNVNK